MQSEPGPRTARYCGVQGRRCGTRRPLAPGGRRGTRGWAGNLKFDTAATVSDSVGLVSRRRRLRDSVTVGTSLREDSDDHYASESTVGELTADSEVDQHP